MKRTLLTKICLLLPCLLLVIGMGPVAAITKVVLQLRWYHQFQFAGYYMAAEQGYYRDAGLEVEFRTRDDNSSALEAVLAGQADFGIGDVELLVARSLGKPVVAVAVIFQQSPAIFLAIKKNGIRTVADLKGKKIPLPTSFRSVPLLSLLTQEKLIDKIERVDNVHDIELLISGEVDVISAYRIDEPFMLKRRGFVPTIIDPADYGINFYGDTLFTSETFIQQNPEITEKFRQASIRGWQYALNHMDEAIAIIQTQYRSDKTLEELQFEATEIKKVMHIDQIDIGNMDLLHWGKINHHLIALGIIPANFYMSKDFIYQPPTGIPWHDLIPYLWLIALILAIFISAIILILKANFHARMVRKQLQHEIEERKRVEKILSFERDNMTRIFAAMEDGIYIVDANFDIQYVSPVLINDFGPYNGRKCYEYFHDRTEVCPWCKNNRVLNGETVHWEFSLPKTDKTYDLIDTPLEQPDGSVWKLEIFRDITELKQSAAILEHSERKFRLLAEHTHDWEYWRGTDGEYVYLSPACEVITGYRPEEFIANDKLIFDIVKPEYAQAVIHHYCEENSSEMPIFSIEFPIETKSGEERWIEHRCSPLFDEEGNYVGRHGNNRDITERKLAEETQRKYEHILSATKDQMSFVDLDYIYQAVNRAYLEINCKTRHEIVGYHVAELMTQEVFEKSIKVRLDRCFAGEEVNYQQWFEYGDVKRRYLDVTYYPYFDDNDSVSGAVVCARDITTEKQAEETSVKLLQAINQSSETIVFTDNEASIIYTNPAFERSSGYTCEEALGQNPRVLKSEEHDDTFYQEMWSTLTKGDIWHGNLTNKKKNGSVYVEEATISPVTDESGEIVNYIAVKRDITHEVDLEEQLRQKYKLEAVGVMAGGMAHNFNNNLSVILGNIELTLLKLSRSSDVVQLLENAKVAVFRSRDLVQQILTYSRNAANKKTTILPVQVVSETMQLLQSTIPKTVNVQQIIDPDIYKTYIHGDFSQVQEVLINLCNNAVHALDESGELIISLDTVDLEQADIPAQYECFPGQYVRIGVCDNGCGMSSTTIGKIFDLFFTTKEVDKGTGIGLSTVQGIMEQHAGLITVESIINHGTTFNLFFPIVDRRKNERMPLVNSVLDGDERILFVDDDEMIVAVWKEALEKYGYSVSVMTSSVEALKLFTANPDYFDLLVTDQTMPELTGKDLIVQLHMIKPTLRTVLCTGFSNKINAEDAAILGIDAFCVKPLNLAGLIGTIRQVLDKHN